MLARLHVQAAAAAGFACPRWNSDLFPSVRSVKISSRPAGGFMRTSAAGCLSTPLTSQMVGWTWTCSESESSSLLYHTGVPLAAPHLSLTFCLRYICAASVSHRGLSPAKMTCLWCLTAPICSCMAPILLWFPKSSDKEHCRIHASLQSQRTGGFIDSSNHSLYRQMCDRVCAHAHLCTRDLTSFRSRVW